MSFLISFICHYLDLCTMSLLLCLSIFVSFSLCHLGDDFSSLTVKVLHLCVLFFICFFRQCQNLCISVSLSIFVCFSLRQLGDDFLYVTIQVFQFCVGVFSVFPSVSLSFFVQLSLSTMSFSVLSCGRICVSDSAYLPNGY